MAIQVIIELNVAFCERHLVNCAPSDQLDKECTYVSHTALILVCLCVRHTPGSLALCLKAV